MYEHLKSHLKQIIIIKSIKAGDMQIDLNNYTFDSFIQGV